MIPVFDLPTLWAFVIAFAVFAYVVMDGFDLGIGILFPFFQPGPERDSAMNSVAPVWDGNETWLVLGGGGLMAAFPLAYAIILPALYAPIIAMVLALIFRGVAFEFRWRVAGKLALGLIACIGMLSAATPFLSGAYYERWFAWPQVLFTAQVPLLVGLASVTFLVSLRRRWEYAPFLIALALFGLG